MIEVEKNIQESLDKNIPFVLYRKPKSENITAIIQNDTSIDYTDDFEENGFVFAPFDGIEKSLIIRDSNSTRETFSISKFSFEEKEKNSVQQDQDQHVELVKKGIHFINTTNVDKVVLSRKETIDINGTDYWQAFEKLISSYPNAFVYLWFHPVSGLWMGATPEVLLSIKDANFTIMSLASTQEYKGTLDVSWNEKEVEEHQIVTDYIVSKLDSKNLKISDAYSVKAGSLVHLRADISGCISSADFDIKKLIHVLHPTPAVCGMPKEKAKEFILDNEHYNREYYTGFLGEITDMEVDLFVNLRCMKFDLKNQQASLYIGGGITKGSNPEKEWEETVVKSQVMKKVL